jgi:hypothetical protein
MPSRALLTLAALVAAGCSRAHTADAVAPLAPEPRGEVVATVDGRPIYTDDVADEMRARNVDRKTALEDLIEAEALVSEAARRGLDRDLDARLDAKGAMVRRLLETTFEKEFTPADIPNELVKRAYFRNKQYLDHDVYADVWHILVAVPKDAPADVDEKAHALATELSKKARGLSLPAFKQLAAATEWQGAPLRADEAITERDGWTEKPFSHAAFDQLKRPGDVSAPVRTSYGWHVEQLAGYKPAEHVPIETAAPKLRAAIFPSLQPKKFDEWTRDAMARHHVEMHPERLPKPE